MIRKFKKLFFLTTELLLRFIIIPHLRVYVLRLFGATIGNNTRIYDIRFINMDNGFQNLYIENDVHIGTNCLLDLNNKIFIGQGATISPNVTIITHSDAGSYHRSPICQAFQTTSEKVVIEPYCWIGVGSTILSGVTIRKYSVIGACSLVNKSTAEMGLYYGIPAKFKRQITITK